MGKTHYNHLSMMVVLAGNVAASAMILASTVRKLSSVRLSAPWIQITVIPGINM